MARKKPVSDLAQWMGEFMGKKRREGVDRLEKMAVLFYGPFISEEAREDFRRRAGILEDALNAQILNNALKPGPLPEEPLHSGLRALLDSCKNTNGRRAAEAAAEKLHRAAAEKTRREAKNEKAKNGGNNTDKKGKGDKKRGARI